MFKKYILQKALINAGGPISHPIQSVLFSKHKRGVFEQKLEFLFECVAYNGKLPEGEAAEGAIRSANEICLGLGRSNADATT